jgi:DNA primase
MDAKEEVRSRLNIEDVIGEYVSLKRAGRNFKGLSPFTNERTPSFIVSPDKQIWHDFSSSKGGDVFSFVMEVEGIDFRATLELLARKAGVDLSLYQSESSKGFAKKRQRLHSALDLAAQFYQQSLIKNQHALEYVFKKRGLNKNVVQAFKIGYAPNSDDALLRVLTKRGFSEKEIQDTGLTARRRDRLNDMFRGRMMVPLSDGQGQVVGFTARIIADDPRAPKYINTPQTLLYDKGRQVFGLHLAKEAIRAADKVVVVEGNLDVVSSHQAGVKNVVAAAGTALTENHLNSLVRLTENIALAFDGDKAGIAATERAIGLAQQVGAHLTIVALPGDAKDPDELIQKDPGAWQVAIDVSQPVVDWVIERYKNLYDIKTAEGKKMLTTRALSVIKKLQDQVEQEHYIQLLASLIGASESALKSKLEGIGSNEAPKRLKPVAESAKNSQAEKSYVHQDSLLALALTDVDVRDAIRNLEVGDLHGEARQRVLGYILENPGQSVANNMPRSLQTFDTYVKILLLQAETRYGQWDSHDRYQEAAKLVRLVALEKTKLKKQQLTNELRAAEASGDKTRYHELREKLNALIKGA